tara:strand:- start:1560 stop:1667 length:108 start_codon:yes stop_codon:yes gene_type:complete
MVGTLCPEEFLDILEALAKTSYVIEMNGLFGKWEI